MLFTYRNLYGLMDKTLAECIRTRDCGSNLHGGVKKIGTMTTSSRSIYLQNSYNGQILMSSGHPGLRLHYSFHFEPNNFNYKALKRNK